MHDLSADCFAGIIDVRNCDIEKLSAVIPKIIKGPKTTATQLAGFIPNTIVEKHDSILPKEICDIGYGAKTFDVNAAYKWIRTLSDNLH